LQLEARGERADHAGAQAQLLLAAAQAGVPVAAVVAHGPHDAQLGGSWIVTRALEGTAEARAILEGAGVPPAEALLDSIAAALAAVHRMPVSEQLAPAVDAPLAALREQYERLDQPHPVFELAFRRLGGDQAPARRTLVHGDFRLGNLLVARDGVSAVLDWELCHIGDPLEDLGWLCVPAWRFTRPERPAAGLGSREQLAAAYSRHSGHEVDMAALARWELAGTLRWGVICVMQAFTHISGARRSVELAVIGRRACEVEWDLLEMLCPPAQQTADAPDAWQPPEGLDAHLRSLHDRPSASELVAAAREALGESVLPLLQGRPAFELRVAMRALGMVARELEHTEDHVVVRARALAALGAADEAQLAAQIRDGDWDGREPKLCAALRAVVAAKLSVANPRYISSGGTR
jgi:aminoglycoside phosphotransferase (APT) family kinase protein